MKYISADDLKNFLDKQMKYAESEQKKAGHCDDIADAYWAGQIDQINETADQYGLAPLWC